MAFTVCMLPTQYTLIATYKKKVNSAVCLGTFRSQVPYVITFDSLLQNMHTLRGLLEMLLG